MSREYTRKEFLRKMEYEGGPYDIYLYLGNDAVITDDEGLTRAWAEFASACRALNGFLDEYEDELYEDDDE